MSDYRYYFCTDEAGASLGLDLLDRVFEDEGLPVATMEIDEDRKIWEVSIYAPGEPDETLRKRIAACVAADFPDAEIQLDQQFLSLHWLIHQLLGHVYFQLDCHHPIQHTREQHD